MHGWQAGRQGWSCSGRNGPVPPLPWNKCLTVTAALSADIMELDRKIQGRRLVDVCYMYVVASLLDLILYMCHWLVRLHP